MTGQRKVRRSLRARLAASGLDTAAAERHLADAGLINGDAGSDTTGDLDDVLAVVSDAAAPMDALASLTTLAEQHPELFGEVREAPRWLRRVAAVAGTSRPLGDLIARHADACRALATLRPVRADAIAAAVEEAVAGSDDRDEQAAAVARIRRQATADIAARDLTGAATVEDVGEELSALAEGVLTGSLAALHAAVANGERTARIGVIGMGKFGGRELNYVSDVDVIFVHAPLGDEEAANREARVVLEALLRLLNASTTMGRVYEIDPTLRPEGRSGPLSRTPESFVAYWERWARTWEFQALLKARPAAGDRELGAELLRLAEGFVFPEELDPGVVAEIREMKGRVEAKPEVRRDGDRQVKLGPGGLRDIEFAVQLLQLVHGRADRTLRETGTLPTLWALAEGGYVADEDATLFAECYRLLRRVEHRLQLAQERRTHTIPDASERQEWLARSLDYRADGEEPAREAFLRDLRRAQGEVRDLHAKLFYRPLLEMYAAVPARSAGVALPAAVRAMGQQAALTRLDALGFADASAALRHLEALTSGVTRSARALRAMLPAMLQVLQDSPDPDGGLKMLRRLAEALGHTSEILAHLRDHPPDAELLARVLGTSEVAGDLLVALPQGIDWLADPESREEPREREQLVRLACARLEWQDSAAALRRFKRHELLRIVLRDLAGAAPVSVVGNELTALGEACLEAALRAALAAADGANGARPATIAVIAMGRFGGCELNYVSDLDVMFVHEAAPGVDDAEAARWAQSLAETVIRSLGDITAEGTAFEVDADLRPEGRKGPLSRSLGSYRTYYERWSERWEHQALLKARPVAGDADLGRRFLEVASERAYPASFGDSDARAMRQMKARIERERLPRRVEPWRHLKLGPGGLADVEWVVQLLQQRHGADLDLIRTTTTMRALDGIEDAGLVGYQDAQWLRGGYRFLSRVRNRLYLLRQRNVDALPAAQDVLERLARSLGYGRGGRQAFEADYLRHTRHVRSVVEREFYEMRDRSRR